MNPETIRYMFETNADLRHEKIEGSGCILSVDPASGRINSLTVDKGSGHGKRLAELLGTLAQVLNVPDKNFISGGLERGKQFRRAVLPIVLEEAATSLRSKQGEARW